MRELVALPFVGLLLVIVLNVVLFVVFCVLASDFPLVTLPCFIIGFCVICIHCDVSQMIYITKTRLFKYIENFTPKN